VDLHRFRRLVARARTAGRSDAGRADAGRSDAGRSDAGRADAERADAERAGALREALDLWRGQPLTGISGPWADRMREAWRQQYLDAVVVWADAGTGAGDAAAVVDRLADLCAENPLLEPLAAAYMRALRAAGRGAQALDFYAATRRRLAEELGTDPGAELQALHGAILRGDPPAAPPPAAPPAPVPAQLPRDVPGFAGRTDDLARLHELIPRGDDQPAAALISVVSGTAGVGKTALAVHFAHQVAARFPDGQLYVNLHGFSPTATRSATEAVRMFLEALGVPPGKVPADLDGQAALYRSRLAARRMLILLDNARDADQVRPLLPGSGPSVAVVTSRNQLAGLTAVEGARPILVDLPTIDEARQLLAGRLGYRRLAAEPEATDEIIARCARLPLALSIVAARAAVHPRFPIAALAAELREAHSELDALAGDDALTDVRTVFSWSYRTLTGPAAGLFLLLGLNPGPDLTAPAAASLAALPVAEVRPLLAELTRANLVTEHVAGRYSCHDLLRAYAADLVHRLDPDEHRRAATGRLLDHYLHSAHAADRVLYPTSESITPAAPRPGVTIERPADHPHALAWFTAERAGLLAAVQCAAAAGFDTHTWQLPYMLWSFLNRRGHWQDLADCSQAALAATRRLADADAQARIHHQLASAYNKLGRRDDAHAHLTQALALAVQAGNLIGQARTHLTLGHMHEQQGRYAEALEHAEQSLALSRAAGHRHAQALALNGIGWLRVALGEPEAAIAACRQAYAIFTELGDQLGQAHTWDSLGGAHFAQGNPADALGCYRHALALFRERGDRHLEATVLTHLGDVHHATGDGDASRAAWRQALAILTDLDHPDADAVRAKLATGVRVSTTTPSGRPAR
jgi:tetratricopeptide (TPR) repeat protein